MATRRPESNDRCSDENCRYRQLYEGSQTSLADMAAKQAAALRSVTAMKRRISHLIKQHFPDSFAQIERHLGHRFSDSPDDIILTYLEQLINDAISPLSTPTKPSPDAGTDLLRAALRRAGFPVGDDTDLSAWAAIVERTHPPRAPQGAQTPTSAAPAGFGPQRNDDELDALFDEPVSEPTAGAPATAVPTSDADDGLVDLFGDDDGLEDIFEDNPAHGGWGDDNLNDLLDGDSTPPPAGTTGSSDSLDDLFGDDSPTTGDTATRNAPAAAPAGDTLDDLFDDLFDDTPAPPNGDSGPAEPGGAAGTPTENTPSPDGLGDLFDDLFDDTPASAAPQREGSTTTASTLDDLFDEPGDTPPTSTADPSDVGAVSASSAQEPPQDTEDTQWKAPADAEALTVPIRPELVPGRSRRRKPRTPRTRAARPDPSRDLDQGDTMADVEPDVASRISAAVAIPRPMFNADLVSVAGDRDVLDAWSQEMVNLGAVAPVRFVGAKARHRALGPLVLPHGELRAAATEFDNSWWAQVMDKYHGASLYELAVLLSRVGDQIQATDLWDTAARFRLDTPRGLVGLVVHLSGGLEDGDIGRNELNEALSGFARERFTLVAVLNIVANPSALDTLVDCVTELAETQSWRPAYPVVAAHTWEWAANSGRTARLVLGG